MSIREAVRDMVRRFISANLIAPDPHPEPSNLDRADDVPAAKSPDEAMTMALGALESGSPALAKVILGGYLSGYPMPDESLKTLANLATEVGQTPLYDQMADETVHMQSRDILGPLGEDPHIFADKVERDLAAIPPNTIAAILRGEQ